MSDDPVEEAMVDKTSDGEREVGVDQEAVETSEVRLDDAELRAALEAVLLVVDTPAPTADLARAVDEDEARVAPMLQQMSADFGWHAAASTCGSPAMAGGSTAAPTTRRMSSVCSWTGAFQTDAGGAGDARGSPTGSR